MKVKKLRKEVDWMDYQVLQPGDQTQMVVNFLQKNGLVPPIQKSLGTMGLDSLETSIANRIVSLSLKTMSSLSRCRAMTYLVGMSGVAHRYPSSIQRDNVILPQAQKDVKDEVLVAQIGEWTRDFIEDDLNQEKTAQAIEKLKTQDLKRLESLVSQISLASKEKRSFTLVLSCHRPDILKDVQDFPQAFFRGIPVAIVPAFNCPAKTLGLLDFREILFAAYKQNQENGKETSGLEAVLTDFGPRQLVNVSERPELYFIDSELAAMMTLVARIENFLVTVAPPELEIIIEAARISDDDA